MNMPSVGMKRPRPERENERNGKKATTAAPVHDETNAVGKEMKQIKKKPVIKIPGSDMSKKKAVSLKIPKPAKKKANTGGDEEDEEDDAIGKIGDDKIAKLEETTTAQNDEELFELDPEIEAENERMR